MEFYEKIVKKENPSLEELYYLEGFDYGVFNISIDGLGELGNNVYFLNGFDDGIAHYKKLLSSIYVKE